MFSDPFEVYKSLFLIFRSNSLDFKILFLSNFFSIEVKFSLKGIVINSDLKIQSLSSQA